VKQTLKVFFSSSSANLLSAKQTLKGEFPHPNRRKILFVPKQTLKVYALGFVIIE